MMAMRVSLSGAAKNAAGVIDDLLDVMRERYSDEEMEQIEAEIQPQDSIFMMQKLARHAEETASGRHTLAQFANFYCLTGGSDAAVAQVAD